MKKIAQVLCVALILAGLPRIASASGEKATVSEDAKYAALEKESPGAAAFEGGDAAGVLLVILVIAAIAALVYFLMDHNHSMQSPLEIPDAPAPRPAVFR